MDMYCPSNPLGAAVERPDEPYHYRNRPAMDAPSFLRRYLEIIKNLDLIPARSSIGEGFHGNIDGNEGVVSGLNGCLGFYSFESPNPNHLL